MKKNNISSRGIIISFLSIFSIVVSAAFSVNLFIPSHNFLAQQAIGQQLNSDMDSLFKNQKWYNVFKAQEQEPLSPVPEINSHSKTPTFSPVEPSSPNTITSPYPQFEKETSSFPDPVLGVTNPQFENEQSTKPLQSETIRVPGAEDNPVLENSIQQQNLPDQLAKIQEQEQPLSQNTVPSPYSQFEEENQQEHIQNSTSLPNQLQELSSGSSSNPYSEYFKNSPSLGSSNEPLIGLPSNTQQQSLSELQKQNAEMLKQQIINQTQNSLHNTSSIGLQIDV